MAHCHGLYSPQEHRGTKNLRHGVLSVPDAAASRYQTRVRRLEGVGGHVGHRPFQGKVLYFSDCAIMCRVAERFMA